MFSSSRVFGLVTALVITAFIPEGSAIKCIYFKNTLLITNKYVLKLQLISKAHTRLF